MPLDPTALANINLAEAVTAVGTFGTAAAGLVDVLKTLPGGGISHVGYAQLERAVAHFMPKDTRSASRGADRRLYDVLHANWINGTALSEQKAIAKALIKLRLDDTTAAQFAEATGVDATVLASVGRKMGNGQALDAAEVNVLGRFDLQLTTLLDDGYLHADQRYRNASKLAAMVIAIVLAVVCAASLGRDLLQAALLGLLSTPLAPITKDLTSALSAGVKALQVVRK